MIEVGVPGLMGVLALTAHKYADARAKEPAGAAFLRTEHLARQAIATPDDDPIPVIVPLRLQHLFAGYYRGNFDALSLELALIFF